MTASIIDGKAIAASMREQVRQSVARMKEEHGYVPGLATVLVGDNPASATYVRSKQKTCEELGIRSIGHDLPADATQERCTCGSVMRRTPSSTSETSNHRSATRTQPS